MSFLETCGAVAQRFVQTVVIVDDQAFAAQVERPPEKVVEPSSRGFAAQETDIDGSLGEEGTPVEDEQRAHGLKVNELSRQFASLGIVCAAYAPVQSGLPDSLTEEDAANTAGLARHADIVVIDWLLDGKRSTLATKLIQGILDTDMRDGGRLRLLAIYTGEGRLQDLRNHLLGVLNAAGHALTADDAGSAPAINGRHLRIAFLNKAEVGLETGPHVVSVTELPQRLVEEFATMTRGIMPSVALASISAVREGTHFVLSKFNASLDGTLAVHRALLPEPEDAAAYASDLVAKELSSILETGTEAHSPASLANMRSWLDHEHVTNRFRLRPDQGELPLERLKDLLTKGATESVVKEISSLTSPKIAADNIWKFLPHLYCGTDAELDANHAFARLACLKKEAFGETYLPAGWRPSLTLGSLLVEEAVDGEEAPNRFYVCMQALCDSVRLETPRHFPLLPLRNVLPEKKFSLAARLPNSEDVWLAAEMHPYMMIFPEFQPDTAAKAVKGQSGTAPRQFRFVSNAEVAKGPKARAFLWLGDLRPTVAQRIAHELSARVGRIGLDEYEWLRRKAK